MELWLRKLSSPTISPLNKPMNLNTAILKRWFMRENVTDFGIQFLQASARHKSTKPM